MTTPTDPTSPTGYPPTAAFGATGGEVSPAREGGGNSRPDAGATADTAKDEARRVASTAGDQVQQVTDEAGTQVRRLADKSLAEARDQTDTQMTRIGGSLREIADELRQMAGASEQQGVASQLVGDLAHRGRRIADWLENHGPDEALTEVRRYARRNPVSFLAAAAGAGLVVGRFARALQEGAPERPITRRPTYPEQTSSVSSQTYGSTYGSTYGGVGAGERAQGGVGTPGPRLPETASYNPYSDTYPEVTSESTGPTSTGAGIPDPRDPRRSQEGPR
ncbi:hypothetical protein [Raineyella fluvialis]|uniref:Uncharacterized protein n=1 Tax=Raineyella fluvialis TaxID=2662261 RepID=A0A5Q2F7Q8_9ACTN|nr:hypothetical protein [Raineyella fluvialis]QGF22491.1 hypothetical protein Rai3103_00960 [Raineyella fluvialis]